MHTKYKIKSANDDGRGAFLIWQTTRQGHWRAKSKQRAPIKEREIVSKAAKSVLRIARTPRLPAKVAQKEQKNKSECAHRPWLINDRAAHHTAMLCYLVARCWRRRGSAAWSPRLKRLLPYLDRGCPIEMKRRAYTRLISSISFPDQLSASRLCALGRNCQTRHKSTPARHTVAEIIQFYFFLRSAHLPSVFGLNNNTVASALL